MVDKITTVRRKILREKIGMLTDQDMVRLRRAAMLFFGFAGDCPANDIC